MTYLRDARFLLVTCGILLGFTFPMAKLANQVALPVTTWVIINSLGASIALLPLLVFSRQLRWPKGRQWRYVLIAGPLTFAGPNLLVFLVVPKVGAGYGGVMFALSPVCTLLLAHIAGLGQMNRQRYLGLLLGLSGAVGISLTRDNPSFPAEPIWLLIAALLPFVLALGNVYRTIDWPENASPELLAFWSHTLAALIYSFIALGSDHAALWQGLQSNSQIIGAQLILAGLIAPLLFRLQRFGGPVLLSQIGYVAAGTSLLVATLIMGERYPILTWLCAFMILLGVIVGVLKSATIRTAG